MTINVTTTTMSEHPTMFGRRYHNVDLKKILYHFSSVANKSLLCPYWETSQRQMNSRMGCEFCPRNVSGHEVEGSDERYDGSQSLRSLPETKCVFWHVDDIVKELGIPAGYQ